MKKSRRPSPIPDLSYEQPLWTAGRLRVAGIDEAGRGALAGPVSAAAVILPAEPQVQRLLHGVRDSKQMSAVQMEIWAARVKDAAVAWGVGFSSHKEIDQIGIVPATCLAMQRALSHMGVEPDHLLVDYLHLPDCGCEQTAVTKGDAVCLSIACASVLAKTARDAFMMQISARYPEYGFDAHKGYGTQAHQRALRMLGASSIHRRSFAPIAKLNDFPLSES